MKEKSLIITITQKNFKNKVLENPQPTILEIGADWCGACHIMTPILEKVAYKYKEKITIGILDIDTNEEIAKEYGVNELRVVNGEINVKGY